MDNDRNMHPPKLANRLLLWFLKSELAEEVEGDLAEKYYKNIETASKRSADINYWYQVFNYLRPFAIRPTLLSDLNPFFMLRHNLKISIRKFQRNKVSFLINLIGLSTGLACVLFICLWVNDELKVDKFSAHDARLYQIMHNIDIDDDIITVETTPFPLAKELMDNLPEVERAIGVNDFFNWQGKKGVLSYEEEQFEVRGLHAAEDFFEVFSYPLLQGNKELVLTNKNGIVLSKRTAENLFGTTKNCVGKSLEWKHTAYGGTFQVTGIFEGPPERATDQFDVVLHLGHVLDHDQWASYWTNSIVETYVLLREGTDVEQFNSKIAGLLKSKATENEHNSLFAMQYSSKYLYGEIENGKQTGSGKIAYVRLFSLIALFLLLIACINFMNLSTAEASLKMKEIGVRKTIGASRKSLIAQLLAESVLLSFIALVVAVLLVIIALPAFNEIAGKSLSLEWDSNLALAGLAIVVFTGLVAGCYPAFYLSGFQPVTVLKGKLQRSLGELWVRKGLVIFQFSLSIILTVGLIVINEQMKFTQTKPMGYDRSNVVTFQWKGELYDYWNGLNDENNSNEKFYSFMEGLNKLPGISNTTTIMRGNILDDIIMQSGVSWPGKNPDGDFLFKSPVVGEGFIETLGIKLLGGRSFSRAHNDDYFSSVIVNKAAARLMGMENPVGQRIQMNGDNEIIGLVDDFHYGSLYNSIEPLIFRFDINSGNILAKIEDGKEQETIKRLQAYYQQHLPGQSLDYRFLDEDYARQYESETRVASLSKYFASLAILISCLGLFGLAMFVAQSRRKEIGIRKVLGSGVFGIIGLLSKDFTKPLTIAIIVSVPLSFLLANRWLRGFEYHINLQWWHFVAPALIVLLISWATIGIHTVKAARSNPVEALKME